MDLKIYYGGLRVGLPEPRPALAAAPALHVDAQLFTAAIVYCALVHVPTLGLVFGILNISGTASAPVKKIIFVQFSF